MFNVLLAAWAAGLAAGGAQIHLRYAEFDPRASVPTVPADMAAPAGSRLLIVQYSSSPGDAERAALAAAGCAVLQYIPDNAYVVRVPPGANVLALPGVRWAGAFH